MFTFIRHNARWLVGGFMLTYFSGVGQTYFISASVAEWQAAFDLSHGEFGRLYMLATLASAVCLPFVGKLLEVHEDHVILHHDGEPEDQIRRMRGTLEDRPAVSKAEALGD